MHETGVIHGRFQVLHNDHMKYLLAGAARCRHLVVGVTNPSPELTLADDADPERSLARANPLTYWERHQLVRKCLQGAGLAPDVFSIVPFPINLPQSIHFFVPMDATFFLTIYDDWGRRKLERLQALGLATEVLWEKQPEHKGISASHIREQMAAGEPWEHLVPPECARLLCDWDVPARLGAMPFQAPSPRP